MKNASSYNQCNLSKINSIKSTRADSRIRLWKCSDVSETNSVPMFRVLLFYTRWSVLLPFCSFTVQRLYLPPFWARDVTWVLGTRNVGTLPHPDAAICPRRLHWILSPRMREDYVRKVKYAMHCKLIANKETVNTYSTQALTAVHWVPVL